MHFKLSEPISICVYGFSVNGANMKELKSGIPKNDNDWYYEYCDSPSLSADITGDLKPEIIDGEVYYEIDFSHTNAMTFCTKFSAKRLIKLTKIKNFYIEAIEGVYGMFKIVPIKNKTKVDDQ